MHRLTEREFFEAVLKDLEEIPSLSRQRFLQLLDEATEDRAEALRRLIVELSRE